MDVANCWIVAQGGRVYALSSAGVVLNEITAYNLNVSFTINEIIKDLAVTASGQIILACTRGNGYGPSYQCSTRWDSLLNTMITGVTAPVTSPAGLSTSVVPAINNISGFLNGKFFNFADSTGAEVFYYIYYQTLASPTIAVAKWISTGGVTTYSSTTAVGGMATAAGTWNYGTRVNHRLFMATPVNTTFKEGKWRIIGQYDWSNEANARQLGCSIVPYDYANFSSMSTAAKQLSSSQVTNAYGIAGGTTKNFSIVTAYDTQSNATRILYSNAVNYTTTWIDTNFLPSTGNNNITFHRIRISKYAATVSLNNTSYTPLTPFTFVYDNSNTKEPRITLTGTSGHGVVNNTNIDRLSFGVFSPGVNKKYTVSGPTEIAKVSVTLTSDGQDFVITKDQPLNANGFYRSTDTYLIPPGASIKLQSDTPLSINSMLTIVEEV